jgi:hypothetical protein
LAPNGGGDDEVRSAQMPTPRRSKSINSYAWQTRAAAAAAVLLLVGGIVSDVVDRRFWERNPLLAGLASSVIVVVLTVALVNEVVERRRDRRWTVLAQYVLLQLVRDARAIWTGLLELAGLLAPQSLSAESIDAAAQTIRDTSRVTDAVRTVVTEPERLRRLHASVSNTVIHNDEVLGRWAGVMLASDVYAEIIDRHVELAGDMAWLGSLLDNLDPSDDDALPQPNRRHPAAQIGRGIDNDQLTQRLVAIAQLAEELDRVTLELALRLVPVEWWVARLGTTAG